MRLGPLYDIVFAAGAKMSKERIEQKGAKS